MLRITIDLLPGGDDTRARTIATGTIANDGSGDWLRGNYDVTLTEEGSRVLSSRTIKTRVTGFARQERGSWELLREALRATLGVRGD